MIADKVIPESYRQFYANLPVWSQANDYVPNETGDDDDDAEAND